MWCSGLTLGEPGSRAGLRRGWRFLKPGEGGVVDCRFERPCHDLPITAKICQNLPPSARICHGLSFLSKLSLRRKTGPLGRVQYRVRENVSARVRVRVGRAFESEPWGASPLVGQMEVGPFPDLSPSATSWLGRTGRGSSWARTGARSSKGWPVRPQKIMVNGPRRAPDDLGEVQRRGLAGAQDGCCEA